MINSTHKMLRTMSNIEVADKATSLESDSSIQKRKEAEAPTLADFMNCFINKDRQDYTPFS